MTRVVIAVCLLAAAPPAAARNFTPAEYRGRVERAARSLEQARSLRPARARGQAVKALEDLPARADIREPGGEAIAADNRQLIHRLRADIQSKDPIAIRRSAASLRALAASLATSPAGVAQGDARAAVAEVLRRREFRETAWDRFRRHLGSWVRRLWIWLVRRLPQGSGAAWLADLLAGLLIAGAAILVIVVAVHAVGAYRARTAPAAVGKPVSRRAEATRQPRDWLEEADALAGRGEFREAVRALHMAALLRLDRLGMIEYHESVTDGRFLNLLRHRGRSDLVDGLRPLVALFERTWYGGRSAEAYDYRRGRECWARVEALAGA